MLSSNRKPNPCYPLLSVLRVLFVCVLFCGTAPAIDVVFAQNDVAPELLDRPPVAAPTAKIETGAIPVVLSQSQEADNFATGLIQGLMARSHAAGIGLVVVKDDHVILQRNVGTIAPDSRFTAGRLSELPIIVAAMQLVEHGQLKLDADISQALGETSARGITLANVLTFQAGDPELLMHAVEKASGAAWPDYFAKRIALPLGMTITKVRGVELETNLTDMSHLAIALVNGGSFQNGLILMPGTVALMESTHFTSDPVLPGIAYGFTEMRRNGWRALQHDGIADDVASRLVVVPDAKLSYFVVAKGHLDTNFWRALDNGLFDKLLPTRNSQSTSVPRTPPPTEGDARNVAGTYEPRRDVSANVAPLKLGGLVRVRAGKDASLILTGAQSATLTPRTGGYWASVDGNLIAVAADGELRLSTGTYDPLALYKRSDLYVWLALLAGLGAGGLIYYEKRHGPQQRFPSDPVLGLISASVLLLVFSALVWLLAPGI
jgi:CubicO group peptidase (beta-lactamase class C family)